MGGHPPEIATPNHTNSRGGSRLSRDWLGVELNPDFAELAHQRIQSAQIARLPRGQP